MLFKINFIDNSINSPKSYSFIHYCCQTRELVTLILLQLYQSKMCHGSHGELTVFTSLLLYKKSCKLAMKFIFYHFYLILLYEVTNFDLDILWTFLIMSSMLHQIYYFPNFYCYCIIGQSRIKVFLYRQNLIFW